MKTKNNIQKDNFHFQGILQQAEHMRPGHWVISRKAKRELKYNFSVLYHPFADELIETLNTGGMPALFDAKHLASLKDPLANTPYVPNAAYVSNFPSEEIDVSDQGTYSIYNWELFFHAPLAIAVHLSKNQRFSEAQRWFHYIFDPTCNDMDVDPPQRFWKFLRFRQETSTEFIGEMMKALSDTEDSTLKGRIELSIQAWRNKPFQPHVVARGRYLAYQINVVMKYLDNLIAWGDNLFRQDTIETLNEATQVYVLAANILGPKPQPIPPRGKRKAMTFAQLKTQGIDKFGNAMVEMENEFPFNTLPASGQTVDEHATAAIFGIGRSLYFCIPPNDKLLAYWDTVADRLFKIRHCMNFDGVVRQLPLFEPPIDPGMLVKAVAAGLDIAGIVNNINQPVSNIRGLILVQKALETVTELRAMGRDLLNALEKKDAEHIGLMKQQQETRLRTLVREISFLSWKESEAATEALVAGRRVAFEKYRHFQTILGTKPADIDRVKSLELIRTELNEAFFDSLYDELMQHYGKELPREAYRKENEVGGIMAFAGNVVTAVFGGELGKTLPLNKNENAQLNIFLPASDTFSTTSSVLKLAAPILALIPQFDAHATPLGVGLKTGFGGVQLEKTAKDAAEILTDVSNAFKGSADRASLMASFYRRAEEYVMKSNVAVSEIQHYNRQIMAALIREQYLKKDYENTVLQIEQALENEAFLSDKFTNEDLYTWMKGELAKTYFDTYKFAFDLAKRAERTLKHELMRNDFEEMSFIKYGYWDNARQGLLAGESLYFDLKRLEMAYHDQNLREFELTKHVELSRLDPMALLKLKATGTCQISLPEWLFDLDSPGHYMRRIKTVALSIPSGAGPYTGIHCKLSLLRSSIRTSPLIGDDGYGRITESDDIRFRDFSGAIQSVVTSNAVNDNGLFELSFADPRYLPFEGAGTISSWRLELPNDIPQFDHDSITDVILHVRYTARDAANLRPDAIQYLMENVMQSAETPDKRTDPLLQMYTLNTEFAPAWDAFKNAVNDNIRSLAISVVKDKFPYWVNSLGMASDLNVVFACIDWDKKKLSLSSKLKKISGDIGGGWPLNINKTSDPEIFSFLKKNKNNKVHMLVYFTTE